ncbi:NAD(P)-binding oxidoreductase [Actinoplanes sp. NPDC089786]|uniref:NAD(P)-dependent oxidoreductase n=1 Tax=Actinoplanes sp. NPDC089786 TaxID=3155185 RepID=UPI003423727D
MRLLIVGASGGLGRQVVGRAVPRGHEVTALVRRAGSAPALPGVREEHGAVGGDLAAVSGVMAGQEAVVSALGNPLWVAGRRGPAVLARAAANLVTAMHLHRVRRVVLPLAWGAGRSRGHTSPPLRLLTRVAIRRDYHDFDTAEAIVTGAGLDATIVYFGALTDRPGAARTGASLRTPSPLAVSRTGLAACLIDQAESRAAGVTRLAVSGAAA